MRKENQNTDETKEGKGVRTQALAGQKQELLPARLQKTEDLFSRKRRLSEKYDR